MCSNRILKRGCTFALYDEIGKPVAGDQLSSRTRCSGDMRRDSRRKGILCSRSYIITATTYMVHIIFFLRRGQIMIFGVLNDRAVGPSEARRSLKERRLSTFHL